MNHTNFSIQIDNSHYMNLSGSGSENFLNFTHSFIKNTVEHEREGPSQAMTIFSYIMLAFFCTILCICCSLICYTFLMDYCGSYCDTPIFIGWKNHINSHEDNTVTIRERDSMKQDRVLIKNLNQFYQKYFH